jgi:hypothetical protein
LDRRAVLSVLALATPAAALALTQTHAIAAVIAAQVVLALLLAIISIRAGKLLHDGVPSNLRAGVSSGVGTLSWVLFLPFSLGFGWFARAHGLQRAGWFLTAAALLVTLLLIAPVLRHRPRPAAVCAPQHDEFACKELVELVTDYLDGVLPPELKDKFQAHLAGCDGCVEYVRQIGLTIGALQEADLHATSRPQASASSDPDLSDR